MLCHEYTHHLVKNRLLQKSDQAIFVPNFYLLMAELPVFFEENVNSREK